MDDNVIAAMAKWPNVPDVFGWLSLTERGEWRLHPNGDATTHADGEPITSPPILRFIDRNYAVDSAGRWFFQNGPQRVFVRLDAAPYILRTEGPASAHGFALCAHNGLRVNRVLGWWLTELGKLYAKTDIGPGLLAGSDMADVLSAMVGDDGTPVLDTLESRPHSLASLRVRYADDQEFSGRPALVDAVLSFCKSDDVPETLGFVQCPRP